MNDRDIRRENRLQRVVLFGQENAADFAPDSEAKSDFTKIAELLTRLANAKLAQNPVRVNKKELRETLAEDFRRISATARKIETRYGPPGFAADYQASALYSDEQITTHARRVLAQLADGKDDSPELLAAKAERRRLFIRFEWPADFVTKLQADSKALAEADSRNASGLMESVESTARIIELLAEGTRLVDDLDTMMENKYRIDAAKLHAWQRASRVESAPRRKSATAGAPAATPTPPAVPAT